MIQLCIYLLDIRSKIRFDRSFEIPTSQIETFSITQFKFMNMETGIMFYQNQVMAFVCTTDLKG